MVEQKFGDEVLDQIILDSNLPNDGAYTAVGTYPYTEIIRLVSSLSALLEAEIPDLLVEFGKHAFDRFASQYPGMFEGINDSYEFLSQIQNNIHVQVLKLYPEAQLPMLKTEIEGKIMKLHYLSERRMSDLAEGLIMGCLNHFPQEAVYEKKLLRPDKSEVCFTIKMQ